MKTIADHLKDAELWIKCARLAARDHGPTEALWRIGQAEISLNLAKRQIAAAEGRAG